MPKVVGPIFARLRGLSLAIEKRDRVTSDTAARIIWKFPLAKLPSMFLQERVVDGAYVLPVGVRVS